MDKPEESLYFPLEQLFRAGPELNGAQCFMLGEESGKISRIPEAQRKADLLNRKPGIGQHPF